MDGKRWLKADFHMHTHYSRDANMSPHRLIRTAKAAGLDVIGVTDHNTTAGAKKVAEIVKKTGDNLIVFIGQETKTLEGEVIILNVEKDMRKKQGLAETCRQAKKLGGFLILPHPFDPGRSGVDENITKALPYIDAMEVFNSRCMMHSSNIEAMEFAARKKIPMVAGSDSHTPQELGSSYTLIHARPNRKDILDAIKRRQVRIEGKRTGIMPHIRTAINRFKSHPTY